MSQPEVLDGMRAPRTVRLEEARARQAANPEPTQEVANRIVASIDPTVTVYMSKYRRYRVQITAPRGVINSLGQKEFGDAPLVAEFDEHIYRNNGRDLSVRKMIDQALQANPYFGKFGSNSEFWLLSEQKVAIEKKKLEQAAETLKALPREVVEQFVANLRQGDAEDHDLTA